jgi:peptidoglycan/xylan/chitin deacetylase (PgdA/CDA1 family)
MRAGPQIAALLYHEVTDDVTASGFQRRGALAYKLTRVAFARHLAEIATSPLAPTLVSDVDLTQPGRHLLLTFDDGGRSAVHAGDELSRRGWKGHFFIVTGRIGSPHFVDASEIRYLRSCGHLIGSHSDTHPGIFREQPPERMLSEWRVSCDVLAQLLGEPCLSAAVPGGHISHRVLQSGDAAGLRYLFTSEPRLTPYQEGDCWILGRFTAKVSTPLRCVRDLAHFRGWTRAWMAKQLRVLAYRSLPGLFRLYVRSRSRERGS